MILMETLVEHHKAEVGELNNKFNNTILSGVNMVIPEFVTEIPNIAKKCEEAINRMKEN